MWRCPIWLTRKLTHMFRSILVMALVSILSLSLTACSGEKTARSGSTTSVGTADIGGAFTLVDETGAVVTEAELLGQPHLIYFGFSYCPDVCPTALQKLGAAQEMMGKQGGDVGYILFSVDPERDTPESLKLYVTANGFPDGLRGFTGTVQQVEVAKAAYKVFSRKTPLEGSAADYTVDHQDLIFLMSADGKFVDYFSTRSTPADISQRVIYHLKSGK